MSLIPSTFVDGSFTITDDAANSQTFALDSGEIAVTGILPSGRVLDIFQAKGATDGARLGERQYPTITITGKLAAPDAAFHLQALGKNGGFVSTILDLGDGIANDFDFSFDYLAETRDITGEDAALTAFDLSQGSPSTVTMTFTIIGPLSASGTVLIASR